MCYFVEEAYLNKFLNSKYKLSYIVEKVNPEMKDFANFVQELIDYIDYGREGFESSGREGIERVGREGTENAGELYIEQQLPERNGESDANGTGADATEGAAETYSDGREEIKTGETRFREREGKIEDAVINVTDKKFSKDSVENENWLSSLFEKYKEYGKKGKARSGQDSTSIDELFGELDKKNNRRIAGKNPAKVEELIQEANRQGGTIFTHTASEKELVEFLRKIHNDDIAVLRQEVKIKLLSNLR